MIWTDVKVCRSSLPRVPACNLLPTASVGFREGGGAADNTVAIEQDVRDLSALEYVLQIIVGTIELLDLAAQLRIDCVELLVEGLQLEIARACDLSGYPRLAQPSPRIDHFYFFLSEAKVGCHAAAFRLGAAAITLIFSFFGFLASRLPLCWPFAMSISLGLRMTQIGYRVG
jgi:hypothetical protein